MILPCAPSEIFKFDVRVAAKDCPPEYLSLKDTVGGKWDDVSVEKLASEIHTDSNSRNVHM